MNLICIKKTDVKNINIKNYNVEKDEKLQKLEEYSENKNTKKYLFKVDFMGIYNVKYKKILLLIKLEIEKN